MDGGHMILMYSAFSRTGGVKLRVLVIYRPEREKKTIQREKLGRGSHPPIDTPLRDRYRQCPLGSPPRPPRHPYATTWQGDEYSSDFEEKQRPQPCRKGKGSDIEALVKAIAEQTHDVHHKVPEFNGKSNADTDTEAFIEWLDKVERVFNYNKYGDPKQVVIIESRLISFTLTYWNSVRQARPTWGYRPIAEWWKMRRELNERFISMNYGKACARLQETKHQRLAKQASKFHAQYRPPVQAATTTLVIPTVTTSRTFVLGNCYGCGKSRHHKRDCPAFAKKVGLVVNGMHERVITTVQRVLHDEEDEEIEIIHVRITSETNAKIMKKMILVGLSCIQTNPLDRPLTSKVVDMLEGNPLNPCKFARFSILFFSMILGALKFDK
ncbi:hypothetical protein GIB67_018000, partial [Kingdonia uniflora]